MNRYFKKVLVLFVGLITILLLLEIALRIVGALSQGAEAAADPAAVARDTYTILCLGDSHTLGYGVSMEDSYPSQLQNLLNSKSDKTFRIINKGLLAQNTAQLLAVMPKWIDRYDPDLVILLSGGSNHWNYYGYHSSAESALYRIRVFKLIKLLIKNVKDQISNDEAKMVEEISAQEKYEIKLKRYLTKLETHPNDPEVYFYIGYYNYKLQNIDESIKWLKKGIAADPHYGNSYLLLNLCYAFLNDWESAIVWMEKQIVKNPKNGMLYDMISSNYQKLRDYNQANIWYAEARKYDRGGFRVKFDRIEIDDLNELEERASKIDDNFKQMMRNNRRLRPDFYDFAGGQGEEKVVNENMDLVLEWVRLDLIKMTGICREKGKRLIIINYALKPEKNSWTITSGYVNLVLEDVANETSVPFVDVSGIFKNQGSAERDFFIEDKNDAHPNRRGYGLFAKSIYEKMAEENILGLGKKGHLSLPNNKRLIVE